MESAKMKERGDSPEILETLRRSLTDGSPNEFISICTDPKRNDQLQQNLHQLMPIITAQLVRGVGPKRYECARTIFSNVVAQIDPEDVLLQLIEEIRDTADDARYLCLVEGIAATVQKLPSKRVNSVSWGLHAINNYVHELDADEDERIMYLVTRLLPIYECGSGNEELRLRFLVQLLGYPFACLNIRNTLVLNAARALVEQVVRFNRDVLRIPDLNVDAINALSLSVFFYLVLAERIALDVVPQIYNPVYVFQRSIFYVSELLTQSAHEEIVWKGLKLFEALLDRVRSIRLQPVLLDLKHHSGLCKNLTTLIVYGQIEMHRKLGLALFKRYLLQFEAHGRYLLVYNLPSILSHSGLTGFVVTVCKDMISDELNCGEPICFASNRLFALLNKFCRLPHEDPVEMADEIVATLNLLRFLVIRDKENVTGVHDYLSQCKTAYLQPLKGQLAGARDSYKLLMGEVENETQPDSEVSVKVGGKVLGDLSKGEKLRNLHAALTTIDVIDSLVSRLSELIGNA